MSDKKLHIKLFNKYDTVIIDTFINHVDAVNSNTILYYTNFQANQDEIFRLIETINNILVTSEGVSIFYNSGSRLLITRIRA